MPPSLTFRDIFTGPPRHQAVTAWQPLGALIAIAVMAGLIIALQILGLRLAAGLIGAEAFNAQIQAGGMDQPAILLSTVLTQVPLIAMVWLAAGRGGLRAQTLQMAQTPLGWGACLLVGGLLVAVLGTLQAAFHLLAPDYDLIRDARNFVAGLKSPLWWYTVVSVGLLAPISEEMAVRGFLLTALAKSRLGIVGGGLVSNVLWTGLHFQYSIWGILTVFCGGLILTWLVWRTGSLRAAIVGHIVGNAALLGYLAAFAT